MSDYSTKIAFATPHYSFSSHRPGVREMAIEKIMSTVKKEDVGQNNISYFVSFLDDYYVAEVTTDKRSPNGVSLVSGELIDPFDWLIYEHTDKRKDAIKLRIKEMKDFFSGLDCTHTTCASVVPHHDLARFVEYMEQLLALYYFVEKDFQSGESQ